MPDRRNPHDVPERIERLNRALDRIAAGQPAPVLDDAELQELVALAGRLQQSLPRDMPDPGFREELKEQLEAGAWGQPRRPAPLRRAYQRSAFPYPAAAGAIVAVLVAAIAVGSLAIWTSSDPTDDGRNTAGANLGLATPTQAAIQPTGADDATTSVALTTTSDSTAGTPGVAVAQFTATTLPGPTVTVQRTRSSSATATLVVNPTATRSGPTATAATTPAATPTGSPQLAALPPVDGEHLEPGPVPLAAGSSEPPSTAVAVSLATSLPDLADSAPLYTLAPPDIDPRLLVEQVAEEMGIDGPIVMATDGRGNVAYRADGSNGAMFFWVPEIGAFTFTLPQRTSATPAPGEPTTQEVVANTLAWLDSIGYPADSLNATPLTEEGVDGSWTIELWTNALPFNSFGHPLGVRVTMDADGNITGGTGFWLTVSSEASVSIRSSDEAWKAISSHQGYWTGGGIASGGGEFTVDTLFLGYTLTRDEGDAQLTYQPTIIAQGDFRAPNGDAARVTVYLQASR